MRAFNSGLMGSTCTALPSCSAAREAAGGAADHPLGAAGELAVTLPSPSASQPAARPAWIQGLTLVRFSAQPWPFLTQNIT